MQRPSIQHIRRLTLCIPAPPQIFAGLQYFAVPCIAHAARQGQAVQPLNINYKISMAMARITLFAGMSCRGPPHMLPSSAAATSLCRALRPAHIQGAAYATSSDSNSSTNTIDSHDRDAVGPSSSLLAGAADAAQDAAAAKAAASADVTNAQATPAMDTASFQVELKGHQREMGGDSLLPDGEQHPADPYAAEQQAAPRPDDYHEEGDGAVGPSSSFPA